MPIAEHRVMIFTFTANLCLLALYQTSIALDEEPYSVLTSAGAVAFHCLGQLILGGVFFAVDNSRWGAAFLISGVVSLLIGFGSCALFID